MEFLKIKERFGEITDFQFSSSESLDKNKSWTLELGGGVWLDIGPNALSILRAILSNNDSFNSFKIEKAKFKYQNYNADIKANVALKLNNISGTISLDWLADEGFKAKTVLTTDKNQQIVLDHANHSINMNNQVIWQGKNNAYRLIYKNFLHCLLKN